VDLDAAARDIRGRKLHLPDGAKWLDSTVETVPRACFRYPISRYPSRLERLQLTSSAAVAAVEGNLLGLKGQYLLLSTGVFNVSRHAGFRVRVDLKTHALPDTGEQLGLF